MTPSTPSDPDPDPVTTEPYYQDIVIQNQQSFYEGQYGDVSTVSLEIVDQNASTWDTTMAVPGAFTVELDDSY